MTRNLRWLRRINPITYNNESRNSLHSSSQRKRTWTPVQVTAGTLLDGGEEVINVHLPCVVLKFLSVISLVKQCVVTFLTSKDVRSCFNPT